MRFAIYGTGGIGGYFGARLAEAGHDVHFIARGAQLAALHAKGLKLLSPLGDVFLDRPQATDDPRKIGEVDCVILGVKTWQVREAAEAMRPLVGRDTVVLPLLNGVEASDQLAEVLGGAHVLGGLAKVFSKIESPGVIRHFNTFARIDFGELAGGRSARAERLRQALARPGIDVAASEDIRTELWKKLVIVSSWAGLGALARSPIGALRTLPETRELIDRAIDEGIDVGVARGHAIEAGFKAELWRIYDALPADATASMQRDIMEGKPSELDAWNGAIVRFGAAAGVETPVHEFTCYALLPMERRARGQT
ncbi:MAG: 2-dehydropantoate 2-reductase [Betaproteobacteria bacterium]|nr:2-dehydropantoate 2-reductase [Betaproteobacteria bacterium]